MAVIKYVKKLIYGACFIGFANMVIKINLNMAGNKSIKIDINCLPASHTHYTCFRFKNRIATSKSTQIKSNSG